jgi:hypothetical protein
MTTPLDSLQEALEKRLGLGRDLTEAEVGRAEAAIEDASNLVRDEADQEWTEGFPPAVATVVLEAAKRGFLNPAGYSSETTGPFTVRHDAVGVYLTDKEAEIIRRFRPSSTTGSSGLWTQATTRSSCGDGYVFVDDQYGGDSILYGECC